MDEYIKGEDIELKVSLQDTEGTPVAPSVIVDYELHLIHKRFEQEHKVVFAKNATGSEKTIIVEDDSQGALLLRLDRAWSDLAEEGEYFINGYLYYSDSNFTENKRLEIIQAEAFELLDASFQNKLIDKTNAPIIIKSDFYVFNEALNNAPVAVGDSVTTDFETSILIDVLANDTDLDSDTLSIQSVGTPSNGTAVIESGQVRYTPADGYDGADSFTYVVSDGNGGTDTGTVNVTVNEQVIEAETWVFMLGGQSNVLHATNEDGAEVYPDGTLQWGRYLTDNNTLIPAAVPLQHNLYVPETASRAGFVTRFANLIKAANPNVTLVFIPCAEGGTGFSDNRWNKGDDLYEDLVTRTNLCMSENPDFILKGMLWHQGETDSLALNASYEDDLISFINNWREDVNAASVETPFVCGGMLPSYISSGAFPLQINNIIKDIPNNVFYTGFADSESPTVLTGRDTYHFTLASSLTLGDRYYDAYLAAIANIDNVAPTVVKVSISSFDSTKLVIEFDERVQITNMNGLSLSGDFSALTISSLVSGNETKQLIFQLSGAASTSGIGNFVYSSSNTITDLVGNSLVSGSKAVDGFYFRNALITDGGADYVSINSSFPSSGIASFSIVVWFEVTTGSDYGMAIANDASGFDRFRVRYSNSLSRYDMLVVGTGGVQSIVANSVTLNNGIHMAVFTYDRTGNVKIYSDSVLVADVPLTAVFDSLGNNLFLGAERSNPLVTRNTIMPYIALHKNKLLNQTEIDALWNSRLGADYTATISQPNHLYLGDIDDGDVVWVDHGSDANNGTLNGFSTPPSYVKSFK